MRPAAKQTLILRGPQELALHGRETPAEVEYLVFTHRSVVAGGPQRGGWRCVWNRNDFLDLYGLPPLPVYKIAQFFSSVWKLRVKKISHYYYGTFT